MTQPKKLTIDIYSDVMCPWCIIGYSQLQKGLAQLEGEIEAEVRWLPFELNPDMPPEGEESVAHIARKYGRTAEQAKAGRDQMLGVGERAGYSFAYTGAGEPPPSLLRNTFAAHKLLKWALFIHPFQDVCGVEVEVGRKKLRVDLDRFLELDDRFIVTVAPPIGIAERAVKYGR